MHEVISTSWLIVAVVSVFVYWRLVRKLNHQRKALFREAQLSLSDSNKAAKKLAVDIDRFNKVADRVYRRLSTEKRKE